MDVHIDRKPVRFLYNTPLLHQTYFWSQVKQRQGFNARAFDLKVRASDINPGGQLSAFYSDDMLVLFHPVSRDEVIGYVPYGPALAPQGGMEGLFLEELSESIRPLLPDNCIMLRYDLPWRSPWDELSLEAQAQEIRFNFGTKNHGLRKAPTDMLPANTMILNLVPSEQEILMGMKPKTRYNIRLALKKGVNVRVGGYCDLDVFYGLYRETCQRNGLTLHDRSFFESLYQTNHEDEGTGFELLVSELDGTPLSAMFLAFSSNRATYLYGASSSSNRESMSTYALQWAAIRHAKASGCTQYDLFGVSPETSSANHPMAGLYRFKQGFGGDMLNRLGCWDFCLQPELAEQLRSSEAAGSGYHLR